MRINKFFFVAFLIASLFIISCDLFTGPKVDLFKTISDEVDWAHADKLTVRLDYPVAWGISNPVQGALTPAKDIRKGYPFEIEFTPDLAWSLYGWRAYKTSSLPANWLIDIDLLDGIERLDGVSVEVPELPARGGTGSFIINTTENITLVPWCETEPYVLRTVPRHSPPTTPYPRGTPIEIYFNAPLSLAADELSALFKSGIIKITADGDIISEDDSYYNYPVYSANNDRSEYMIIITAHDVPPDSLIEVTVGPDIFNMAGKKMAKAEVFSFSTAPAKTGGTINSWNAFYTESAKTITIEWTTTGIVTVEAHYRINRGEDIQAATGGNSPLIIEDVDPPNGSGVIDGNGVSNIQEYEVFLDLIIEGVKSNTGSLSFKVWNFPGMSVSKANPALEIRSQADLNKIRTPATDNPYYGLGSANAGKQYVLVNDITLYGYTPIGSGNYNTNTSAITIPGSANTFLAKFYGAGRTITVNDFTDAVFTGVFGTVFGGTVQGVSVSAVIRDLTVYYAGNVSAGASAAVTGGVAGYAGGGAKLLNITVRGAMSHSVSNSTSRHYGGVVGYMDGAATTMENIYGGLNISLTTSTGTINAGGIAGSINNSGAGCLTNCVFAANTSLNFAAGTSVAAGGIAGVMRGGIANSSITGEDKGPWSLSGCYSRGNLEFKNANGGVGGLIGSIGGSSSGGGSRIRIRDCVYEQGYIYFQAQKSSGSVTAGGIVGGGSNGDFYNCHSRASRIEVDMVNGSLSLGGFAGGLQDASFVNCVNTTRVLMSDSSNPILVRGGAIGGFIGSLSNTNNSIKNCTSEGSVKAKCNLFSYDFYIGGFAGQAYATFLRCSAKGNVEATIVNGENDIDKWKLKIGGLAGETGTVTESWASGSVYVKSEFPGNVSVGGLLGSGNAVNCYAWGNVLVDSPSSGTFNSSIWAGGLIGSGSADHCYARGWVEVKSGSVSTMDGSYPTDPIYAGGIVGEGSNVRNSAALGLYVITRGNAVHASANRITGKGSGSLSANYANNAMRIGNGDSYWGPVPETTVSSDDATTVNGADVLYDDFTYTNNSSVFWLNAGKVNFSSSVWKVAGSLPILAWE